MKELFYGKTAIRFSLKNGTKEMSLVRVRVNINGERLTYYLPSDYKICPKHWDSVVGCAIEDAKRNPDLKGNPRLQLILRNINCKRGLPLRSGFRFASSIAHPTTLSQCFGQIL